LIQIGLRSGADFALPALDRQHLFGSKAERDQAIASIAHGVQFGQDAAGCSLRGGRWVVQFVGQVAGQLAERGEFLALLLDARDFADAVEQSGDDALAEEGMAASISGNMDLW
jgi:hypothetical protein